MSDTTNFASSWVLEGRVLKAKEWGHYYHFSSILIEECNGTPLCTKMGMDNTFDLGYVRAQAALNHHRKMFGSTQEFRVVLKEGHFDEVGKEFTFKGLAQRVE